MLRNCLALTLLVSATTIPAMLEGKGRSCVPGHRSNLPVMVGSTIRLVPDSVQGSEVVADAIAYWEACPGYGTGFPRFVTSEDGDADSVVPVRIETRLTGPGRCGHIGRGGEVVLFDRARDDNGFVYDCRPLSALLAHELGHVLGLADAEAVKTCRTSVMAPLQARDLRRGTVGARPVLAMECELVDARWLTWEELERPRNRFAAQRPDATNGPAADPRATGVD